MKKLFLIALATIAFIVTIPIGDADATWRRAYRQAYRHGYYQGYNYYAPPAYNYYPSYPAYNYYAPVPVPYPYYGYGYRGYNYGYDQPGPDVGVYVGPRGGVGVRVW